MRALFNSGLVSITSTASVLVFSSMVGYALARLRFVGRDSIFNLVLLTMMIPGQLLLIPFTFWWSGSDGPIATVPDLPAMISNMGIIVFRQFFKTLPQDLIDAARSTAAPTIGFCSDILAFSKPVLICGIISFIGSWNEVLWPLIVIRRWSMMTMPQMVTLFHVGGLAGAQVAAEMALP